MTRKYALAGVIAGLTLFAACTTAPAAVTTTAASSAPAQTAAAPGGQENVDDFIARIVAAQATVRTYSVELNTKTAIGGTEMTIKGDGVVDQTDRNAMNIAMNMDMGGLEMELIKLGDQMYIKMAAAGDSWFSIPKDKMDQYSSGTHVDYAEMLANAKESITKVTYVGDDTVDGTSTSHYRLTMAGDALGKMGGTGTETSTKVDGDSFDYDLWLDDADLTRKVAMELTMVVESQKVPMKLLSSVGDYNEPVTITAPSKDKISELPG